MITYLWHVRQGELPIPPPGVRVTGPSPNDSGAVSSPKYTTE